MKIENYPIQIKINNSYTDPTFRNIDTSRKDYQQYLDRIDIEKAIKTLVRWGQYAGLEDTKKDIIYDAIYMNKEGFYSHNFVKKDYKEPTNVDTIADNRTSPPTAATNLASSVMETPVAISKLESVSQVAVNQSSKDLQRATVKHRIDAPAIDVDYSSDRLPLVDAPASGYKSYVRTKANEFKTEIDNIVNDTVVNGAKVNHDRISRNSTYTSTSSKPHSIEHSSLELTKHMRELQEQTKCLLATLLNDSLKQRAKFFSVLYKNC